MKQKGNSNIVRFTERAVLVKKSSFVLCSCVIKIFYERTSLL